MQCMAGSVGPPLPSLDLRLEGVPEMNYNPTGNPPQGEILFKGASVFSGYFKQEDKTQEVPYCQNHCICFACSTT